LEEAIAVEGRKALCENRPRLNRRGPIYTSSKVINFWYFNSRNNSKMGIVVFFTLLAPSGSQLKSNNYVKKHPPVIVGQWSPSSSEDG
jgi:hypothetical protein